MVHWHCLSVALAAVLVAQAHAPRVNAAENHMEYPNLVGGALGLVVPVTDGSAYLGYPVDSWGDRDTTWSVGAFYFRKLTPAFRVGALLEMESVTVKLDEGQASGRRMAVGVSWLGHYPDGPLSMELGGVAYLGLLKPSAVSPASSTHWDTLKGLEYGIVIGPALEIDHLYFAIHWEPLHSWYSANTPSDVTLTDPRIRLKVGYAF